MSESFRERSFWAGFALSLLSIGAYVWERKTGADFALFPLLYHTGVLLLGLGLMMPRFFPTTLDTIRAVFGRKEGE